MAKLWQLDYGYKVKTPEGEKGYVTGITEKGKIEISLREKPYSGVHDITEPVSNLEVLVIGNPHNICDIEYDLVPDKQTEFTIARLKIVAENPEIIIKYPEYFTAFPKDDWIKLAEKYIQKEIKKNKMKVSKEEINQEAKSLVKRLNKKGKK